MGMHEGPKRKNVKSKRRRSGRAARKSSGGGDGNGQPTGIERRRNKHWSW